MKPVASQPWYHLDNAAMMYSAIQRGNYSALYRFSAVMTDPVDPQCLQRAIDKTMPRFPGFQVKIQRGFFWYYFERDDGPGPVLQRDIRNPCQPVRFQNHDKLIRFFYYEKRISMEVFHTLADGGGALVLFKTLLAVYLRERGHEIPNTHGILDITQPPQPEEWEDAYARYAHSRVHLSMSEPKAYACTGTPEPFYTLNVTMGFVSVGELHAAAKGHGASITEYLAAVLLQSILRRQRREGHRRELPVSLAVPINLRPYFPSSTLRNFVLTVRPSINPELGDYTLDEIIAQVHHHMRLHITRQEIQAVITKNVSLQHILPLQLVPSPVKNFAMAVCAGVCCGLLNFFLWPGVPWSLFVVGACAVLWVWLVPPLLLRRSPSVVLLLLDLLAVGGLLVLIGMVLHGNVWLYGIALPVWAGFSLILLAIWMTAKNRSFLSRAMLILGGLALFLVWLEYIIDCFLGAYHPMWSLIAAAVAVTLMLPLAVIRTRPNLRRQVRRRFHF